MITEITTKTRKTSINLNNESWQFDRLTAAESRYYCKVLGFLRGNVEIL